MKFYPRRQRVAPPPAVIAQHVATITEPRPARPTILLAYENPPRLIIELAVREIDIMQANAEEAERFLRELVCNRMQASIHMHSLRLALPDAPAGQDRSVWDRQRIQFVVLLAKAAPWWLHLAHPTDPRGAHAWVHALCLADTTGGTVGLEARRQEHLDRAVAAARRLHTELEFPQWVSDFAIEEHALIDPMFGDS